MNTLNKVLLLSALILTLCSTETKGQLIRFDHFDTRSGLSQNNINSLIVDSTGYVWMGTIEGITRFDGTDFVTFRSIPSQTNSLEGNFIEKIAACPNGNIWVHVQDRGLNLYDAAHENFKAFDDSCFYPANVINLTSFVSASDTLLWFTDLKGLYTYNVLKNETHKQTSPSGRNDLVYAGNNRALLWGVDGISVYSLNEPEKAPQQIFKQRVWNCSTIFNDSLVVINAGQLYILNIITHQKRALPDNDLLKEYLRGSWIIAVAGYENEIWIGTSSGLVLVTMNRDKIERVSKFNYNPFDEYSFHGQDAKSFAFDKAGNLWIGTSKYGINFFSREKNRFTHHPISALLKADKDIDPIRAICKTADGDIWTGFDRLGLVRIHPDNTQVLYSDIYFPDNQIKSLENIRSIYQDSQGQIWLGTNRGLCCYNPSNDHIESTLMKYGWEWPDICYRMHEFEKGKLTITNIYGIGTVDLKTGNLVKTTMPNNFVEGSIRSIVKDEKSDFWFISADLGLCKLTPEHELKYYNYRKNNFTDNKLYSLELIGDTMWISSNNGLMAFDLKQEKVVSSFFETDGLSNNLVYASIHVNNDLWISTNRGISRLNLTDFSIQNFMTDNVFMDDAFFVEADSCIYFGGYDGFVSFCPAEIELTDKPIVLKPQITDLYINNQRIKVGDQIAKRTILNRAVIGTDSLVLDFNTNSFELGFDAFPFSFPDQTFFRYRVVGQSNDWVVLNRNSNRAVITKLDPGEYTFEVEASEDAQDWSAPRKLMLAIIPPFYLTSWFKIMIGLLFAILLFAIHRVRVYAIKQWNLQLETQIKEQTQSIEQQKNKIIAQKEKMVTLNQQLHEADQAKLNYYTNLSHEFRTPLTIIMGNIEILKEQSYNLNQTILKNINRSTDRLYRLVNQFIDLHKYDQGELKLQVSNFDIVAFTQEIADTFKAYAYRKNIRLEFIKPGGTIPLWLDRDKTDKIIYNILTNAIKYTDRNGTILIDFEQGEDEVILKISDTGVGISEDDLANIYKRFFRGEKLDPYTDGHGMGLTLVNALMNVQKGKISCASKKGKGTTFSLIFKKGNNHFKSSDFALDEVDINMPKPAPTMGTSVVPSNPAGEEILLVEDNPDLLDYLSAILGKSYKIRTATNGKEALDILYEKIPDLIITDLMMPLMDGLEFSKIVREMPGGRFVPIIMLSAKTDATSKIEGFKNSIDDYIEKPFNPNLLLSRAGNLLHKYDEIKKDTEQQIVSKNNNWSKSDKEFFRKVLVILANNYSNPEFNTETLAGLVGMSRVTFYRRIKNMDHENPGKLIQKYRLNRASELVKEGSKSINEICIEVGFQSLSNFRKSFKEEFGLIPSKYKEMYS